MHGDLLYPNKIVDRDILRPNKIYQGEAGLAKTLFIHVSHNVQSKLDPAQLVLIAIIGLLIPVCLLFLINV